MVPIGRPIASPERNVITRSQFSWVSYWNPVPCQVPATAACGLGFLASGSTIGSFGASTGGSVPVQQPASAINRTTRMRSRYQPAEQRDAIRVILDHEPG